MTTDFLKILWLFSKKNKLRSFLQLKKGFIQQPDEVESLNKHEDLMSDQPEISPDKVREEVTLGLGAGFTMGYTQGFLFEFDYYINPLSFYHLKISWAD